MSDNKVLIVTRHNNNGMGTTSIPVDTKVRDRLRKYAVGDMTYNDVLTRLMDEHERDLFVREIQREADAASEWFPAEGI